MLNNFIDLNGKWICRGTDSNGKEIVFEGTVPGCVHTDLINFGLLKDIYYRDNSKGTQWIEKNDFSYRKSFTVDELSDNAFLEFDGLDTYCDIYLNGKLIGSCDDMFISYSFSIDGILKTGENIVEVAFHSPIKRVEGKPSRLGCFTTERLYTRRMQCTYSWDWVDRFVTMGIFRDARIVFHKQNEIDNYYFYTSNIGKYGAEIRVEVNFRDFARNGDELSLELTSPDGTEVFKRNRKIIEPMLYQSIYVPSPELWYPNGYGDQPLYSLTLKTSTSEKRIKIGIRSIVILQVEDRPESAEKEKANTLQTYPHCLWVALTSQA